jgi:hypothetical protein
VEPSLAKAPGNVGIQRAKAPNQAQNTGMLTGNDDPYYHPSKEVKTLGLDVTDCACSRDDSKVRSRVKTRQIKGRV